MNFTILYWYFCTKRNCGIPEFETQSEYFKANSLEEAKKYTYSKFLETKTSPDAWHFCHRVRLIKNNDLETPVFDWFWKEKDKIVEEYSNEMVKYEKVARFGKGW